MRTTIRLDNDVLSAAERLRRERHIGLGEAVNELARAGVGRNGPPKVPFRQRTAPLGMKMDVSNVAEVLELLNDEEP